MALFPTVPDAPGVPALLRAPQQLLGAGLQTILLVRDVLNLFGISLAPQWGVFDDEGRAVIAAESCVDFEYKQSWNVSDYPVEEGGFETYNKVDTPFDVRIRFASGRSETARMTLLKSIESVAGTTETFQVRTPEKTYLSCTITRYDYRRKNDSVGLLLVDVWLLEVRADAASAFTNTQQPSGASPRDAGIVQPIDGAPANAELVH